MANHDYNLANASGAAFRSDLNNALQAIVTNNSSSVEPTTKFAYMLWADTTAGQLKLRNSTNDGWIVLLELDGTKLIESGSPGAPGLAFTNDTDSGFYRRSANDVAIATGGIERLHISSGATVFNEDGGNVDFRVETDTEPNALYLDGGTNRLGVGTASPGTKVEIDSSVPYVTIKNSTQEDTDGGRESRVIFEGEQSGGEISSLAQIEVSHDGVADDEKGKLVISTNDGADGATPTAALTVGSDQSVTVAGDLTANGIQYPSSGALSHRNLIINGAMNVAQRGTQVTGVTTSGYRTCDRFKLSVSNLGTWTVDQSTDAPKGFSNSFKATCTTADSSPAAADFCFIAHLIEAQNLQHLNFGTSDAESMIVSFWVKSSRTGNGSFDIGQPDNSDKLYSASYQVSVANTWEYKTISIPADTAGLINNDNGVGLDLTWWLNSGSQYTGGTHPTSWIANDDSRRNASNLGIGAATSDNFAITGVQLELGTVATPFERRGYGEELSRCQRYFLHIDGSINQANYSAGNGMAHVYPPVYFRDTPSSFTYTTTGMSGTFSANLITKEYLRAYYLNDQAWSIGNIDIDAEL